MNNTEDIAIPSFKLSSNVPYYVEIWRHDLNDDKVWFVGIMGDGDEKPLVFQSEAELVMTMGIRGFESMDRKTFGKTFHGKFKL